MIEDKGQALKETNKRLWLFGVFRRDVVRLQPPSLEAEIMIREF